MDYYDYDTFCRPTRDLNLKHSPLAEWPHHSYQHHNTLLYPDHGEDLGGFLSYPHYQQPRIYDALNLPHQQIILHSPYKLLNSPYSAVLQSGGDSNFVSVPSQDSMEVPLSHSFVEDSIGDEDAEGEEDPASSATSSSPIPIPVPNLTKKSRGRRVPTMSSLEDLRSASSGAGKKRHIGGKTARMYLCEVKGCGKCFARGEHLKRHVRSIHTYEKREVYFSLH
jgi:uncharacterized Zn-finger protein